MQEITKKQGKVSSKWKLLKSLKLQNRLSDGKEFDVMVRDDIFWFYAFNKLVLAESNSTRFAVRY